MDQSTSRSAPQYMQMIFRFMVWDIELGIAFLTRLLYKIIGDSWNGDFRLHAGIRQNHASPGRMNWWSQSRCSSSVPIRLYRRAC